MEILDFVFLNKIFVFCLVFLDNCFLLWKKVYV